MQANQEVNDDCIAQGARLYVNDVSHVRSFQT